MTPTPATLELMVILEEELWDPVTQGAEVDRMVEMERDIMMMVVREQVKM